MSKLRETDLYPPIKRFLESQGYEVKAEVATCDVVAQRKDEDPVVVELKTSFTLPLLFQGLRRQTISDQVYLAIALPELGKGAALWRRHHRDIVKLCRMLGLGLMVVGGLESDRAWVEVRLDPGPYQPRKNKRRRDRLLGEFQRRVGDPNQGGSSKRPVVTAYRQDALRCACYLHARGPAKVGAVREETGVTKAAPILQRDVYGWFERVERGIYAVTPRGEEALVIYADVVAALTNPDGSRSTI